MSPTRSSAPATARPRSLRSAPASTSRGKTGARTPWTRQPSGTTRAPSARRATRTRRTRASRRGSRRVIATAGSPDAQRAASADRNEGNPGTIRYVGIVVSRRATNPWVVLVLICLAQFMVILDATIVNVALPSIQTDLGLSEANLQWIINAYTLVFGGFLLLGGRLGDLVGRKRVFLAGLVIFTTASLLNGLAVNSSMLIGCRALQGLGAALVSPAALSIITTTFAEGAERARALGVWAAIAIGGSAVGLLLGGVLTQAFSWPWIFFVNVPVGIAALILSIRLVPESRDENAHGNYDIGGAVTATGGLMTLVYAIVKTETDGWTSSTTLGLFAVAFVLLTVFVLLERRAVAPLVRLSIFRVRSL
ncbi:MAG: MFS transporter, partial [Actinobacteria bacterium]